MGRRGTRPPGGGTDGAAAASSERVVLVPDGDGRGGWTVVVDGVPSSHLDLADPTRLDFEYMRWIGDLLDVLDPGPLRVAHLGGAGCTLARYVEATRPGSAQVVLEVDAEVIAVVRAATGLRSSRRLRVRQADAREGLAAFADGGLDVVVRDAFADGQVPAHLTTDGFLREVRRVLAPGGVYVANVADRPPMSLARAEAATARSVLGHVALAAEPAQFKGRRYGNVVLAAADVPLPVAGWGRRLASGAVRARLVEGDGVAGLAARATVLRDGSRPVGAGPTGGRP